MTTTPKKALLAVLPEARLDYYESLRVNGKQCWFIRVGMQGTPISSIASSPAAAWKDALLGLAAIAPLPLIGKALSTYPWAYAAYLGKGRNKGWIIRDARNNFAPLTVIRRETQGEAWADLALATVGRTAVAA